MCMLFFLLLYLKQWLACWNYDSISGHSTKGCADSRGTHVHRLTDQCTGPSFTLEKKVTLSHIISFTRADFASSSFSIPTLREKCSLKYTWLPWTSSRLWWIKPKGHSPRVLLLLMWWGRNFKLWDWGEHFLDPRQGQPLHGPCHWRRRAVSVYK